jgi:hypothetical protein
MPNSDVLLLKAPSGVLESVMAIMVVTSRVISLDNGAEIVLP